MNLEHGNEKHDFSSINECCRSRSNEQWMLNIFKQFFEDLIVVRDCGSLASGSLENVGVIIRDGGVPVLSRELGVNQLIMQKCRRRGC